MREAYTALGLQTYFTSGETETKAWTIYSGWTAPQAAGVIHSDFERYCGTYKSFLLVPCFYGVCLSFDESLKCDPERYIRQSW